MKKIGELCKCKGIYKITNTINKKCYIGRSTNIYKRYYSHRSSMRSGKRRSINSYFYNSVKKYGFNNFTFEIIKYCNNEEELLDKEIYYINLFNSYKSKYGYNLRRDSKGGMITNERTRLKQSENLKRQWKNGLRKNHGKKLSKFWNENPNVVKEMALKQRLLRTKFKYIISDDLKIHCGIYFYNEIPLELKGIVSCYQLLKKKYNARYRKRYTINKVKVQSKP